MCDIIKKDQTGLTQPRGKNISTLNILQQTPRDPRNIFFLLPKWYFNWALENPGLKQGAYSILLKYFSMQILCVGCFEYVTRPVMGFI